MDMAQAIIEGNKNALQMAISSLTKPSIICTNPPFACVLDHVSYVQSAQAQVSELPVIIPGQGVKQFQYDNVAPTPWQWQITGYIPGDKTIEKTNIFTPVVRFNTDVLRNIFRQGRRIIFKAVDCQIFTNCVIESLQIEWKADAQNEQPFTMTIKEIKELKADSAELTTTEDAATPEGESAMDTTVTENVHNSSMFTAVSSFIGS